MLTNLVAFVKWACRGENLGAVSPESPKPRTGMRSILFGRDTLTASSATTAVRPDFWRRFFLAGETLPAAPQSEHAGKVSFGRWLLTGETLPSADAATDGGTRPPRTES